VRISLFQVGVGLAVGYGVSQRVPWPASDLILQQIYLRDPTCYEYLRWSWVVLSFTTPTLGLLWCAAQVRAWFPSLKKLDRFVYKSAAKNGELALELGGVTIPQKGLVAGVAVIGATRSGKTSGVLYPAMRQILGHKNRIGGLVLEAKGDFCYQVRDVLRALGREEDYVEVNITDGWRFNPLAPSLDAYTLAFSVTALLKNLYGSSNDQFWPLAYTSLMSSVILALKLSGEAVTFQDIYQCCMSATALEKLISRAEKVVDGERWFTVSKETYGPRRQIMKDSYGFEWDERLGSYKAIWTEKLNDYLNPPHGSRRHSIPNELIRGGDTEANQKTKDMMDAVRLWYRDEWRNMEHKLKTAISLSVTAFLKPFVENPALGTTFCPKDDSRPILDSMEWSIEQGKVVCINFPSVLSPGIARIVGVMSKLCFETAVKCRSSNPRPCFLVMDEYQEFATVGKTDPCGDEEFFNVCGQAGCMSIIATQGVNSLRSVVGESYKTILQGLRSKFFLTLADSDSAKYASDLCGQHWVYTPSYNLSEQAQQAKLSFGKMVSSKPGGISAGKHYNQQKRNIFEPGEFTSLANHEAIALVYDGDRPHEPCRVTLNPA